VVFLCPATKLLLPQTTRIIRSQDDAGGKDNP
jgi:hypothetical protein